MFARTSSLIKLDLATIKFVGLCVSTTTGKLPVLELALPFPVMVPFLEVGNLISGTAFTVRVFFFLLGRLFSHKPAPSI